MAFNRYFALNTSNLTPRRQHHLKIFVTTADGRYATPKGDQTFASNRASGKVPSQTFQRAPTTIPIHAGCIWSSLISPNKHALAAEQMVTKYAPGDV